VNLVNKKCYLGLGLVGAVLLLLLKARRKKDTEIGSDYFNRYVSEFVPKNLFEQDFDPSPINRHRYIPVSKSFKDITNYPHKHNLPR
jgi:hypothetical protein